jgi:hypothetical protein
VSSRLVVARKLGAGGGLRTASASERWLWGVVGVVLVGVIACAFRGSGANLLLALLVIGLIVVSYQHVLLAWQTMLGVILAVILFVPIRRYTVGSGLPIELEPYRIVIALVLACWFCALAADPAVRWRRSGLEAPIAAVLASMLLSMAANLDRVSNASGLVIKQFSFFASYLLLVYFIVSVVRSRRDIDRMLRLLVGGGTILALAALFEWRTSSNLFNWYSHAIPFLHYVDEGVAQARGNGSRARASAQHPIALSAALVMLVPLAVYLYQRDRRKIWLGSATAMTLGALSTGSRTGTTMLIAVVLTMLWIKPREVARMLPMLLPLLVVIQVVMPGTIGTMKSLLNPSYVIKEQSYNQGETAGRVADLGPALDRWTQKPLLGTGFGTTKTDPNAPAGSEQQILDDQWLGSLLSVGGIGVLALLWLFGRAIRLLTGLARSLEGADAWLATALGASLLSFAVGMLTFDAFGFIQVTFFAFVVIGFTGVLVGRPALVAVRREPEDAPPAQRLSTAA